MVAGASSPLALVGAGVEDDSGELLLRSPGQLCLLGGGRFRGLGETPTTGVGALPASGNSRSLPAGKIFSREAPLPPVNMNL